MAEYFEYNEFDQTQNWSVEGLVEDSLEAEKSRLEDSLERIRELLEEREEVRETHLDKLSSKLDWYIQRLETLRRRPGSQPRREADLKEHIEKFYDEIRKERRVSWRDRQELEAERRELLQELGEAEDTDLVLDCL